jgi:hypothetical protein
MRTIYLLALCVIALSSRSSAQDLPKMLESELPLPLLAAATPTTTPGQAQGNSAAPVAADAAPPSSSLLPDPAAAGNAQPTASLSQNVTINLINRLVQRGALTQSDAVDLIRLAEQDAVIAQNQAQVLAETKVALEQAAPPPPPADEDEYRVTYIPDTVKDQIREDLRQDVMNQAKREGWAAPNAFPEWTSRIKLFGDIRMRHDNFMYSAGNDITGAFPNFNAINTGEPYDTANKTNLYSPQLNANQDRERTRLRMRLGFDIDMEDGFTSGIRMATGGNNSPVSTNQTLGSANNGGQGGNFSKYDLWLDRAFVKYEKELDPNAHLTMLLGRFDNPYMTSSQIMWDEDVGLDGLSFKITSPWQPSFKTFFTGGAFPVFNSDLNAASNSPNKTKSYNKYLIAAQFGTEIKINEKIDLKSSIAYYDWQNLEGQLSDPYAPLTNADAGNTDESRPLFAQKGNTYRSIRNIKRVPTDPKVPDFGNDNGASKQWQYYGLASKFRQIAWSGRLDFNYYEPMQISLLGEYVKNLAFDQNEIGSYAVNNRGNNGGISDLGAFEGGDTAYYAGVNVGKAIPAFDKRGDWAVGLGYRHVESDAVIDGFTDSVFGGGGTNMEGYTLNAAMAISKRAWFRVAYMSATQIAGPQLKSDVFLIDFATKF